MEPNRPSDARQRLARVALSLDGLSVGDALGEQFIIGEHAALLSRRIIPEPFWFYTDDTEMALAIAHLLDVCGRIDQDELAAAFAARYRRNPRRGYGATAHEILRAIGDGKSWRAAAAAAFDGQGSMGNGAAMRAAPVGAYFADDYAQTVEQAMLSAQVTHAHSEGIAGAIAVAVAAAWAARRHDGMEPEGTLFERVLQFTPDGETRARIELAAALPGDREIARVANQLGNGSRVIAYDTVPFALWSAARQIDNYVEAMWSTIAAGGDVDTNCAIVGGIVALAVGRVGIPERWLQSREDLA